MVVLSLYKKTQVAYTQYVDNDVYVDDVDDDEAGAGAYVFSCSDTAMLTSTLNYIEWQGQAPLYCGPMDGSFAECSVEDKPVDCMPNVTRVSVEDNSPFHPSDAPLHPSDAHLHPSDVY